MAKVYVEYESTSLCRCCQSIPEDGNFWDRIADLQYQKGELRKILTEVTSLEIDSDDGKTSFYENLILLLTLVLQLTGLSQVICDDCKDKLISAYEFRRTCIRSDQAFRAVEYEEIDETFLDIKTERQMDLDEETVDEEETEEIIQCPYCEEAFFTSSELEGHFEIVHKEEGEVSSELPLEITEIKAFHIDDAEVKNDQTKGLEMVQKASSNSSKKYKCSICGKHFESPSKVQRHLTVHRDVLHPSEIPKRSSKPYKHGKA